MASGTIVVLDQFRELRFSFQDMLAYHGGGSPGGVAHAFKVLERALPVLSSGAGAERREIVIATAFGGPGARDGFELVTRAVSDGRYTVDASLTQPGLGPARERFVFGLRYRDREAVLTLRAGFVTDEFIRLTRQENRTAHDEARLTEMKCDMATRVMSAAAEDVYDCRA